MTPAEQSVLAAAESIVVQEAAAIELNPTFTDRCVVMTGHIRKLETLITESFAAWQDAFGAITEALRDNEADR